MPDISILQNPERQLLIMIYERHQILTSCLEKLGVSAEIAEKDACKIEHIISKESFEAIKRHVKTNIK